MRGVVTVREHEKLENDPALTKQDMTDLEAVARKVLKRKDGDLAASNYVGVITTKRGVVVEILPKIDLGGEADPGYEKTRRTFLRMLRCWRGLSEALPESAIRAMPRFPMLDVFVRRFLAETSELARAGLARRYIPVEENLPYLRGRLLLHDQLRENLTNEARFFVAHDELSINRPANRLIHSTLLRLAPGLRSEENRMLLRQLTAAFADVPQATDARADWEKHHVDRSMNLYGPVMQWVGLVPVQQGTDNVRGSARQCFPTVPDGEGVRELRGTQFQSLPGALPSGCSASATELGNDRRQERVHDEARCCTQVREARHVHTRCQMEGR